MRIYNYEVTRIKPRDLKKAKGVLMCSWSKKPYCTNDAVFFIDGDLYCLDHANEIVKDDLREFWPEVFQA